MRIELARINPEGIEFHASPLWNALGPSDSAKRDQWWALATANASDNDRDLGLFLKAANEDSGVEIAKNLLHASPDSPLAKAYLVSHDWKGVEGHAADWERAAARQPAVLRASGHNTWPRAVWPRLNGV